MNLQLFRSLLDTYHDKDLIEWLTYGWPIGRPLDAPLPVSVQINHKGANSFPDHIDEYFKKEINAGATIGPFISNIFETPRKATSPLNSRPKRNDKSKRRIILDLSFPKGRSVNDFIPKDSYLGQPFKLRYPTIDTLAKRIHALDYKAFIYRKLFLLGC